MLPRVTSGRSQASSSGLAGKAAVAEPVTPCVVFDRALYCRHANKRFQRVLTSGQQTLQPLRPGLNEVCPGPGLRGRSPPSGALRALGKCGWVGGRGGPLEFLSLERPALACQGAAEARARLVSAGSGFRDPTFSGRRHPCQSFARLSGCLRGEAAPPGTNSLVWSAARIAHPSSKCQQMDAIKARRCSAAGHRYRVWEGWPLRSAYGLVLTPGSCSRGEERNGGAPSFPGPRQGEPGRTPKVQERKGQKKRQRRKAPHTCREHSNFDVTLLIIIKSQQNNGSLIKEIWGARWAKWKPCFQGKAGLVHCT